MSTPDNLRHKYPLDLTGLSQNNRVTNETHVVDVNKRTIFPKEGAFFTKNFVIRLGNRTLVRNQDYKFFALHTEASVESNDEVCSAVTFINARIRGTITIEYNVVGGRYIITEQNTAQILDILNLDDRKVKWEHISNKPTLYHPACHVHHASDIFGLGPMVQYLGLIHEAIQNLRLQNNTGIWKQIAYMYNRQNEFITKVDGKIGPLVTTLEDFKVRFTGENIPVRKADYDIKIGEIESIINGLDGRLSGRITPLETATRALRTELDAEKRKITANTNKISAVENKLLPANNQYQLQYNGSRDAYMTLERLDNLGWKITYNDPPLLSTLETKINELIDGQNTLNNHITRIDGRVDVEKGRIDTLVPKVNSFDVVKRDLTALQQTVTQNNSNQSQALQNAKTELEGRINDVNNTLIKFRDRDLEGLVTPMISGAITPIRTSIESHHLEIGSLKSRADTLERTVNNLATNASGVSNQINEAINAAKAVRVREVDELLRPINNAIATINNTTVPNLNSRIDGVNTALQTFINTTSGQNIDAKIVAFRDEFVKVEDNKIRQQLRTLRTDYEGSVGTINSNVDNLRSNIGTVKTTVDEIGGWVSEKDRTLNTDIDGRIKSYDDRIIVPRITAVNQSITELNNAVEENFSQISTELAGISTLIDANVDPKITTVFNRAKAEDRKLEEWVKLSRSDRAFPYTVDNSSTQQWKDSTVGSFGLNNHGTIPDAGTMRVSAITSGGTFRHTVDYLIPVHSEQWFHLSTDIAVEGGNVVGDLWFGVFAYDRNKREIRFVPLVKRDSSVPPTTWQTLKGILKMPYATPNETPEGENTLPIGTSYIKPGFRVVNGSRSGDPWLNFTPPRVRVIDPPLDLENIPGLNDKIRSVVNVMVREQQNLPESSRWDLSRFRIQPGAEAFSSVTTDANDNLNIRGIVMYDTAGTGDRGIFAPTNTIHVTETQTWNVPQIYNGRLAKIVVRANAKVSGSSLIVSAVREMFVKLEGGTAINITLGDISSFGTYLTVSNGIDYPDAVYPRVTIPSSGNNATNLKALVTITV